MYIEERGWCNIARAHAQSTWATSLAHPLSEERTSPAGQQAAGAEGGVQREGLGRAVAHGSPKPQAVAGLQAQVL